MAGVVPETPDLRETCGWCPLTSVANLDLLFTQSDDGYQVQVLHSPGGYGQSATFALPFSGPELKNLVREAGRLRARTGRVDALTAAAAKHVGGRLSDAIFTGAAGECLRRSVTYASEINALLRMRLRFSGCPDLASLPWELLQDAGHDRFLALSGQTLVVRYPELPFPPLPLQVTGPLRVLVIKPEPAGYGQLDLDAEWAQVASALGELSGEAPIVLTELAAPSLAELRQALLRDTFHVVHYHRAPVTGRDLGMLLRDHFSLRLAVLSSCEGGRADPLDPFAGVAEALVCAGIPAVIATQFEVSVGAAIEFAPALYGALAAGLPVDAAVTEARQAVCAISPLEWAAPVLYLGAEDAQLFTITQPFPVPSRSGPADRIARGIRGVTELIAQTLGPSGRRCVAGDQSGHEIEAPDARIIVENFVPDDPRDVLGAGYVRAMVSEQHRAAHDGAATAAVLAHAMVGRALEALQAGAYPISLMRGITAAVERVSQELSRLAVTVELREQVARVATTSTGDPAIGEMIAEALDLVGGEGIIDVQEGSTIGLELETSEGMRFANGYISPHFATDPERTQACLRDACILVTNATISARKDLQPLLSKAAQRGRPLAIIAGNVEGEALAALLAANLAGLPAAVAVKAPGSGEHRQAMLADIAILTGGRVIGEEAGLELESAGLDLLGRARKVVVTEDETVIEDGAGDPEQICDRVNLILDELAEIASADSEDERRRLRERLCRLAGGMAVIRVGAATEAELSQRKQRTESAVLISRKAIETGLLPGGGAALVDVQRRIASHDRLPGGTASPSPDEGAGMAIVIDSLAEPLRQIVANAGHDPAALADSAASWDPGTGFDVVAGLPANMLQAGIIDTVSVVGQAVANAANLAQRLFQDPA
jgi:chaperonin GroEL